jgi:hypothetical protein
MHRLLDLKPKLVSFRVLIILVCCFLSWSLELGAEDKPCISIPILPKELLVLASGRGYSQISDFYMNRPGMLNPPYVYGCLSGPAENSAAFWCETTDNDGKRRFYLVIAKKAGKGSFESTDEIPWNSYPGGLSIFNDGTTLRGFVYVKDPKVEPPEQARVSGNGILSEYDGVEALFYRFEGEWVVRIRH